MNIVIVRNLVRVVRNPADQETFYLAAGAFSIYVCLFINGMLKVTFGGTPDSAFTTFLALFVVSVALQKWHRGLQRLTRLRSSQYEMPGQAMTTEDTQITLSKSAKVPQETGARSP